MSKAVTNLSALIASLISVGSWHSALQRAFSQGSARPKRSRGFKPHQGTQEIARRRRQIEAGILQFYKDDPHA